MRRVRGAVEVPVARLPWLGLDPRGDDRPAVGDLVLVDDSAGELGINPQSQLNRETQITQQMVSRRVLYAGDAVDITDQLITRMNNAYQSGRTGG